VRKTTALSSAAVSPGSSTRRRPIASDTLPKAISAASTPTAYAAYTSVTVSSENPSLSRYSGYSGVGSVVLSIVTPNA
jgi:hypothetical protein